MRYLPCLVSLGRLTEKAGLLQGYVATTQPVSQETLIYPDLWSDRPVQVCIYFLGFEERAVRKNTFHKTVCSLDEPAAR
jgi:hypothetical protein